MYNKPQTSAKLLHRSTLSLSFSDQNERMENQFRRLLQLNDSSLLFLPLLFKSTAIYSLSLTHTHVRTSCYESSKAAARMSAECVVAPADDTAKGERVYSRERVGFIEGLTDDCCRCTRNFAAINTRSV